MIKLKRVNESIEEKKVTFKDKEWTIVDCAIDDLDLEQTLITIKSEDETKKISLIAFANGNASTDDATINNLVKKLNKDKEQEINLKKDKPQKSIREQAIEDATNDFYAKPKNRKYYDKLRKEGFSWEYDRVYYETFKALEDSAIAKKKRNVSQTVDNTYKGDVDELLAWLKDAISSIDVIASDYTYSATKDIVDSWNKRDGTKYELQLDDTKYATQYIIRLTSKKEILDKMPEEVNDWKAKKNKGILNKYGDDYVYRKDENALTSNDIVFDLIDTYKFHLGKWGK